MNILLLCDEYPPGKHGGIGTAVQLLARTLVRKGHTVVVAGFYHWGYGGADEFDDEGVKVYRFRPGLASSLFHNSDSLAVRIASRLLKDSGIFQWDIKRSLQKYHVFLQKLISDYQIDIVEMPDYNDYIRFCRQFVPFPKLNVPTIVKLHGSMTYFNEEAGQPTPENVRAIEQNILQHADAVVSVSKYTATRTAKYLSYPKHIEVLYNGIQLLQLDKGITKSKGKVIYTGTLVEKKGIYQLMKAWNLVHTKLPQSTLYIFGKGPVNKVRALLSDGAKESVRFMGHVSRDELFVQLAESQVAVFPSYAECFALAPMEAMAAGTAVLYTTRSSGPELITDGINGKLADPDNIEAISSILITLLTDEGLCTQLAEEGQKLVTQKFGIEHIAEQHVRFYQQVIENTKRD